MYSQRATPKSMSFPAKQKLHQTLIFSVLDTFWFWHTHFLLTVQTVPVYSTSRFGRNLNNASPFISGYSSFANPIAHFDSNLIPSNSGLSYTESDVVEDLSFRSTTQSVFPQMDWCRPLRPSTSYIAPVQSDPMISTSRNPYSDIQRF